MKCAAKVAYPTRAKARKALRRIQKMHAARVKKFGRPEPDGQGPIHVYDCTEAKGERHFHLTSWPSGSQPRGAA